MSKTDMAAFRDLYCFLGGDLECGGLCHRLGLRESLLPRLRVRVPFDRLRAYGRQQSGRMEFAIGTDQKVVFVKGHTMLREENGAERRLWKGSMVEVLGPKETQDGRVLLKVRTFAKHKAVEGQEVIPDSTIGWVPEGALFETGDESMWGTE